jgi:hypothetical protein
MMRGSKQTITHSVWAARDCSLCLLLRCHGIHHIPVRNRGYCVRAQDKTTYVYEAEGVLGKGSEEAKKSKRLWRRELVELEALVTP